MRSARFEVAGRGVGEGAPVFIVAEIGANHDGDPEVARKMIDAAAEAKVDAVKFQTYSAAELLADPERVISWGRPGEEHTEKIGPMFDRLALPRDKHGELFEYARRAGLLAFSTPFSIDGATFLDRLNVPLFKIASSDIGYLDLLRKVAATGKPVIVSLGKATLGEADEAITAVLDARVAGLGILHCVAEYPAPMDQMNLRSISTLLAMYPEGVVGLSDHSMGITSCLGAVALGAKILEKHITLDTKRVGPDHWFSADPAELRSLVREVRALESALGHPRKPITTGEVHERRVSTRSLVLRAAVPAGTPFTREHFKIVRPGWGIHPSDLEKVLGLSSRRDLDENAVLTWELLR